MAEQGDHEVEAIGSTHRDRKVAAWSGYGTRAKVCMGINNEGHPTKRRSQSDLLGADRIGIGGVHGRGQGWEGVPKGT